MRAFSFHFCLSILAVLWLTDAVLVPTEQAFLTDLYNSITDRPASWQLNTLATNPCPPWQGLGCTADTQHINYLTMANILGRGSIPESIGNLTSVTLINFGNNMLSGTIPSTISKLKTVTEVHFESNFLTGPLPDIGQMTALQRAYFSSNGLTGTIPSSIGQLANLIEINIASNSLSGSLPDSICDLKLVWNFLAFSNSLTGSIPSCIGNMTTLYNIQLYSNYLSGPLPTSIGQLNNLLLVHLGNNDFSGSIPESICSLKSLSYLYLYNSRFSGPIPDCIGQLQKLTDLQLYTNQLTGTIPESLWSLKGLVNFIASGNKLEGTISESVGNMTSLRIFQVFDNQLSGSIPATIGSLGLLETVYLHNNLFSGTVPESLFGLQRMTTLVLANNRFTGTLSPLIGQAQRMSNFQLHQNQFYGTIPAEIGQLTALRYFFAHLNTFTGTIPDSIGNLAVLEQLYLSNNLLEGTVPPSINNLVKLTVLALAVNRLEGTLPPLNNLVQLNNLYVTSNTLSGTFPDISKLVNLQFLLIGGNSFSGTIPNEWTKLPKLQQISMPNNRFEGTIPSDIGDLPLTILYLEQNLLTGTLPASIGKLKSLQSFTLTSNKLSGTLPSELGGLTSLAVVSFASNSFTGTIPHEFSELQSLTDVYVGINQFEGVLPSFPNATLRTLSAANNKFSGCTPAFTRKPSVCDFTNNPLDCSCFDTTACVKFSPNECVVPLEPSAVQPDNTLPLALGIALGGAVAIGAVLFGVLFSRYKNKKKGLLVELTEPDYNEVAFGKELVMKYRIAADDKYRALEDIMMNRDRTFLSILISCTASTELDMVARSLVFLAHHHNTAAELIEYFASVEILRASSENTIFRTDNMASKMFKYYSKVVGIKYLFDMLARVINELEAITKEPEADKESARKSGVSMLNVDMEMDPNKMEEGLTDKDANALQLALTCQRIITVVINAEGRVPGEFRRIFTRMQATIMSKFGSEEAVYKAVGGFLFLRFIGPSITVPHAYGLTQAPPNQRCQRQLVLIAKVIQHVANMATVTKESFMTELTDFVNKNIPKVKGFYGELLNWSKIGTAGTHRALEVPEEVRLNALAELHEFIIRNDHKMRESIADIEDDEVKIRMNQILGSIVTKYGEEPKRIGATDDKKKKGKGDTELLL